MAHINLLPWREQRRKEQQRQLFTVTGLSALLTMLVVLAVHMHYARLIGIQNARNQHLETMIGGVKKQLAEIHRLEKAKKGLLERMAIIQRLQHNRPEVVHLFDELARRIPEGVHLTGLKQTERKLTIEGVAQSNARVSAFMRNIDGSAWLGQPVLDVIKAGDKDKAHARSFTLHATQIAANEQLANDKQAKQK